MPQRAMTRATASPLQHKLRLSRQAGWRAGGRAGGERLAFEKTEEPSVDTQQPAHLKHTACNDWRHGCLPWGTKQEGGGGVKHRRAAPPLPQQTLMAGAQ